MTIQDPLGRVIPRTIIATPEWDRRPNLGEMVHFCDGVSCAVAWVMEAEAPEDAGVGTRLMVVIGEGTLTWTVALPRVDNPKLPGPCWHFAPLCPWGR